MAVKVLPERMLVLADPNPRALLEAVEEAMERVPHIDPLQQHNEVRTRLLSKGFGTSKRCVPMHLLCLLDDFAKIY